MEDTYQKTVDENGNVIGQVVRQVTEVVNLEDLNKRIVDIQAILDQLTAARETFNNIPDPEAPVEK